MQLPQTGLAESKREEGAKTKKPLLEQSKKEKMEKEAAAVPERAG